jgi:hypothetical protein
LTHLLHRGIPVRAKFRPRPGSSFGAVFPVSSWDETKFESSLLLAGARRIHVVYLILIIVALRRIDLSFPYSPRNELSVLAGSLQARLTDEAYN